MEQNSVATLCVQKHLNRLHTIVVRYVCCQYSLKKLRVWLQ